MGEVQLTEQSIGLGNDLVEMLCDGIDGVCLNGLCGCGCAHIRMSVSELEKSANRKRESSFRLFRPPDVLSCPRMHDFTTVIPRKGTGCIKFDRKPELDPFWVADMDFVSAPPILEALHQRVDHGVFGYPQPHEELVSAVKNYVFRRHETEIEDKHIVHLGGLVPAKSLAARAFGQPGDALMTATPVYPPFLGVHKDAGLDLITTEHVLVDGKWTFDWEAMEEAVTERTRLFLFCNPQNPLGRVFSKAEVIKVAEFCERHDLILISDEIHCDLIFDDDATPFFSACRLPERFQKRTVTFLSPSKTYNIAGLGYAYALIFDDSLRRRFESAKGHTLPEINALAYYAAEAAYNDCENWRQDLLSVLKTNYQTAKDYLATNIPGIATPDMEATYLMWMNCGALDLKNPADHFEKEAGLFLSDGTFFGATQHVRINFGCPTDRLLECLEKMKSAL